MPKLLFSAAGGAMPAFGLHEFERLRARLEIAAQRIIDALDDLDAASADLEDDDEDLDIVDRPHDGELDVAESDELQDAPSFSGKTWADCEALDAARVETSARLHRILRTRSSPLARPIVEATR